MCSRGVLARALEPVGSACSIRRSRELAYVKKKTPVAQRFRPWTVTISSHLLSKPYITQTMLPPRSHRRPLSPSFRLSIFILLSLASLVFLATLSAASPALAVDARALSDTLSPHAQDLLARDPPDTPSKLDGEDSTGGRDDELEEGEEEEEEEETKPEPGDPNILDDEETVMIDKPNDSVVAPVTAFAGELITGTGPAANVTIGEKVHMLGDEDEDDVEEIEEPEGIEQDEKTNENSSFETEVKLNGTDLASVKDKEESKIEDEAEKEPLADAGKTSEVNVDVGKTEEEVSEEAKTKMAAKPPVELAESDDDTSALPTDEKFPFSDAKGDETAPSSTNTKPSEDLDKPATKIPSHDSDADELNHPAYEDETVPEDGTATQESEIDPDNELVVSQEVVYLFLIVLGSVAILAMKGTRAIVVSLFGNVFADKGDYHHLPTHNDGLADSHGIPLTSPRAHPSRASRALNPAPASTAWAVDMSDVIDIPTPRSQPAGSLPGSKKGMQLQGRASKPSSGPNSNGVARATTAPPGEGGQARGAGAQQGGQHRQQQVGSSTATADASWDSWKDGDEDW
ncbi:hypothetical protein BC937DRAFT_87568 [Endogone sp. FLAS-F59071]|nr:hypothetical protein BC937DRAFT_87568 [Endogone sp. FLAS-F59071]|eukprot:RUS19386.1 hypothetical protein BC937DRAFT_87568 [Endogone sp. FLAS-F59071]